MTTNFFPDKKINLFSHSKRKTFCNPIVNIMTIKRLWRSFGHWQLIKSSNCIINKDGRNCKFHASSQQLVLQSEHVVWYIYQIDTNIFFFVITLHKKKFAKDVITWKSPSLIVLQLSNGLNTTLNMLYITLHFTKMGGNYLIAKLHPNVNT